MILICFGPFILFGFFYLYTVCKDELFCASFQLLLDKYPHFYAVVFENKHNSHKEPEYC